MLQSSAQLKLECLRKLRSKKVFFSYMCMRKNGKLVKQMSAILKGALFLGFFMQIAIEYPMVTYGSFDTAKENVIFEEEINPPEIFEEEKAEPLILSVELTPWQYYESTHPRILELYSTFSDVKDENGERVYSNEFIIGLIANIMCEGNSGEVERSFGKCGAYDFALPSLKPYITTIQDINYLMEWQVTDEGTMEGLPRKGSCGVSVLQWSFERRITYLELLKQTVAERYGCSIEELSEDTPVTVFDLSTTDRRMFLEELAPDGKYYANIEGAMTGWCRTREGSLGAAEYAEAMCDFYVRPKYCDGDMSTTGESCISRRILAEQLWSVFSDTTTKTHHYKLSENMEWVEISQ